VVADARELRAVKVLATAAAEAEAHGIQQTPRIVSDHFRQHILLSDILRGRGRGKAVLTLTLSKVCSNVHRIFPLDKFWALTSRKGR